MIKRFTFALALLFGTNAWAADYTVDYSQSQLGFSGIHAGVKFEGKFETWSADITFDPENLSESSIEATFDPATAKTGNPLYDGTLPQIDWFDIKNHEAATFKSNNITDNGDGTYKVEGMLTIRSIERPKIFTFTLSDVANPNVTASTDFQIDRLAYDIGKKSDPKAEWVSQYIDMKLSLVASR